LIVDGHCDVLWKMFADRRLRFDAEKPELQASLPRLRAGGVKLQFFALFIAEEEVGAARFEHVLQYTDIFHSNIISEPEIMPIRSVADLEALQRSDKIGALLSIEGADALNGDLMLLRTAYRLGVRALGLTWNFGNWAADGAIEPRQGGLTAKGRKFVRACNALGIMLDVSHLSEKSFWDMIEESVRPVFASHSNVFELCPHPRNLKQDQVDAIIRRQGLIGLTFVPYFVVQGKPATIDDLLRHLERVCELGGANQVGFGSDFDGTPECTKGLEHAGNYQILSDQLYKRYTPEQAANFLHGNWLRFLRENLPETAL